MIAIISNQGFGNVGAGYNQISLDHLNIEIIDRFLFETYQAKKTVDINRSALRGFLR